MTVFFEGFTGPGGSTIGFDNSLSAVRSVIDEQFTTDFVGVPEDFSVVASTDPMCDAHVLRTRYRANRRDIHTIFKQLPPSTTTYLSYDVMFEPGFDFGDGALDSVPPGGRADRAIIKLPGLANDNLSNSGGNATPGGFSVRTYLLGDRADGQTFLTKDDVAFGTYTYANQLNGNNILRTTNYAPGDHTTTPATFLTPSNPIGVGPGAGDLDNIHPVPGQWHRIVLCVEHDTTAPNNDGRVTMWIDGQPALFMDGFQFTANPSIASQQTDLFAFNTFHGGNADDFNPDTTSFAQFRNFRVATTREEIFAPFPCDLQPLEPVVLQGDCTVAGVIDANGGYFIEVNGNQYLSLDGSAGSPVLPVSPAS